MKAEATYSVEQTLKLSLACGNIRRYLSEVEYQQEMDWRAATDGNVSAWGVLVHELHVALKAFPDVL